MKDISIILVEPIDSANIGSVCRAMKTMHLVNLVIIGDSNNYDENRIRKTALTAFDLYENAIFYDNLNDVVKEYELSVAATRRLGKKRKYFSFNPQQLCDHIIKTKLNKIAIVFGRESTGLTDEEVNRCNSLVTIETSDIYPSLNLSQAVQIICYTLFSNLEDHRPTYSQITNNEASIVSSCIVESLGEIGNLKEKEIEENKVFFKDILSRAGLNIFEKERIEKLFVKVANINKYKKGKKDEK